MAHLQLEGVVDNSAEVIAELREENERLQQENRQLRNDLIKTRAQSESAVAAITALRGQLNPLYRALRAVFGEINLVVDEEEVRSAPAGVNGSQAHSGVQNLDKWEAVKKRLSGSEAELIEVLLTTGPKTNTQLKSLLKLGYSTVAGLTKKMATMGFITKEGDAWALRQ